MTSNYCVTCGVSTRKYKTTHQGHLCHVCFKHFTESGPNEEMPEDAAQLQVFVVRVRSQAATINQPGRDHTIVVLASAPEMASKHVFKQFGYGDDPHASLSWTVDEVQGPFKSGSVLIEWEQ